jgi:hypothetical protein
LLASVHTEDKFKELHKDLLKDLNEKAKDWLDTEITTRNHLICDRFPVMILEIVIGSLLWVQGPENHDVF